MGDMMESAATGIEKNRPSGVKDVELVNQLWQLKQCYQQHVGSYIPLNLLINDLDYRASVLAGATQSQVPELVALAGEIEALGRARAQLAAADSPATEAPATARPRWLYWAAFGALAVLATLITRLLAPSFSLSPAPLAVGPASAAELGTARSTPSLPAQLPPPALRLHGSNTLGEKLAPALVEGLLRKRGYSDVRLVPGATTTEKTVYAFPQDDLPELAVQILAHGSSTAFRDLQSGSADMGMSSRPIRTSEAAALLPELGELHGPAGEHVIALDGLAVIVHPANPLNSLTTQQVAGLFAGDIKNWSSLGGHYGPVAIYARDDQSGTFDTFNSLVLQRHGLKLAPAAQRLESSTELSDLVAKDVGAIGFIGLPYVR
ncbi:MAG TPA: substrate-binding domain-containing protein, partial [Gammaproteobacteria bacterium]|nr:substrate-binding domain-containing protein [Gammaproteobacteria bacterium]